MTDEEIEAKAKELSTVRGAFHAMCAISFITAAAMMVIVFKSDAEYKSLQKVAEKTIILHETNYKDSKDMNPLRKELGMSQK